MARNRFDRALGSEFLGVVPKAPGIYRVFNATGEIIYVGKAKDLRRRLSQYRNAKRCKKHRRMRGILSETARIEWETLPTHLDACLEEIRWIQEKRPRWNIAGAFAFRYPFLGLGESGTDSFFCFSTSGDIPTPLTPYGVFRSRFLTSQAFYSWMELLAILGHSETKRWRKLNPPPSGTYPFVFRRLPSGLSAPRWAAFLRGENNEILSDLAIRLLEHKSARARAKEVQEALRNLRLFWEREALPLRKAIEGTSYPDYPIRQSERDLLFLRFRLREVG